MRTQIFRTKPILVNAASSGTAVVTKDMDGADPFDLFVENVDVAASLRTRFGSKNANVRFVALNTGAHDDASAGALGNDIGVVITAGPGQVFSVVADAAGAYEPYGGLITVNLRCDAGGRPNQLASDVVDLLNADAGVAALVRVSRALGSDGSAAMEIPDEAGAPTVVMPLTYLSGGYTATDLGAVTVEVSPTGWPDFAGPWVADASAATAFGSSIAKGTVKVWSSADKPVRGLRVKAVRGAADTEIVVSAVVRKKGGV